MLTFNRPQKIGRAIESVCAQTFQDWELLVVQDGSHAATGDILREWCATDTRVRHLPRGVVGSIAEASNYGLERSAGEYIAILDDDDYWCDREKLARQVEFLDRNPEYVGCGGGYVLVDPDGKELRRCLKPETDRQIRLGALLANPIANSTAMFRRVVGGKAAHYDERLRGFADWDFWLMIGTRGKLYNVQECIARYTLWEGGGSFFQQKVNTRSAIWIVRKHRNAYSGFIPGLGLAYAAYLYACLPEVVRRFSYQRLSSLKKGMAASRLL